MRAVRILVVVLAHALLPGCATLGACADPAPGCGEDPCGACFAASGPLGPLALQCLWLPFDAMARCAQVSPCGGAGCSAAPAEPAPPPAEGDGDPAPPPDEGGASPDGCLVGGLVGGAAALCLGAGLSAGAACLLCRPPAEEPRTPAPSTPPGDPAQGDPDARRMAY